MLNRTVTEKAQMLGIGYPEPALCLSLCLVLMTMASVWTGTFKELCLELYIYGGQATPWLPTQTLFLNLNHVFCELTVVNKFFDSMIIWL